MIDALLPRAVTASASTPPNDPIDGQSYIVMSPASGDWAGQDESLALRIAGAWQFVEPLEGLAVFNRETGQTAFFRSSWEYATEPNSPIGGGVVDEEARVALSQLIESLREVGVFADPQS